MGAKIEVAKKKEVHEATPMSKEDQSDILPF
jgi:hypothetical protein